MQSDGSTLSKKKKKKKRPRVHSLYVFFSQDQSKDTPRLPIGPSPRPRHHRRLLSPPIAIPWPSRGLLLSFRHVVLFHAMYPVLALHVVTLTRVALPGLYNAPLHLLLCSTPGEREALERSVLMWEMERRGGCCIASYGGGGGVGNCRADVALKVDRIMLRFRPIAPKPAAPPPPPVAAGAAVKGMTAWRARRNASGGGGREGRRGRRARNIVGGAFKEEGRKRRSSSSSVWSGSMVTLPLMPETPEGKAAAPPVEVPAVPCVIPAWIRVRGGGAGGGGGGEVVTPQPAVRPVGSWVTVECVTDTWAAAGGGDEVVRAALEAEEACPVLISDAWDRVIWTNEAYQRMVVGPAAEDGKEEVRVALVTKGMVRGVTCRAFTCRVVVRYASLRRGRGSLTAPCDVWRLDDGGYAWRLDIKAALSLSLGG